MQLEDKLTLITQGYDCSRPITLNESEVIDFLKKPTLPDDKNFGTEHIHITKQYNFVLYSKTNSLA